MRTCNCESEPEPMESESPDDIGGDSLDFDHWTSLISETENTYFDDIEKISSVYDPFLTEFPLCHGYWRRYADHKTRLCSVDKAAEVFERGVQSATYSVPLWVDYCNFSMSAFEDPSDIRRLFRRGLSFVGKDYLCHTLWDQYIEFEYSQQKWSLLAQIYIQALRFPTKKLHRYYESMKRLAASCEEDMKCQINSTVDLQSEAVLDSKVPACYSDHEIALVVKDLLDPEIGLERFNAVQKYLNIGKLLYEEACRLDGRIGTFEINIRRSYFHVKPLDAGQLENWHYYLDFVEMQGDFDWAVKLYERCLIPCANYPEFWMRYVEFMEINGGREIANYALDRATRIFLKRVSVIHLFNARFKEKIGDAPGARAAFLQCETESDSYFVKNVMLKANMEKRMGNIKAASNAYKEALEMAAEKKILLNLPILYVHFSRFTYMMTDNADAARDVLIDGIKHLPHCKQLLEELINFAIMHGGKQHLNVVDSIVAKAISPEPGVSDGLNAKDAEDISSLYLEFVDLCGTIHEVRRAWTRHVRLFPYSMRTASFHQKAISTKPLKRARGTEENMVAMPQQQPVDCNSDSLIELPFNDRKMSLSDNQYIESRQEGIDQLSDDKLSVPGSQLKQTTSDKMQTGQLKNVQETLKPSSPEISRVRSRDVAPEADLPSVYLVEAKQVSPEVSKEPKGNTPEPKASSVELGCQVAEGNESLETSQEGTNRSSVHQVCDNNKPEEYPKPPSLESLSLNSLENSNLDSLPSTSHKYKADSQQNANLDSIPSTSQKYEADFEEHADLDSIPSISHQYEADSQEIKNLDSVPSVSDQYEADSQDNTNLDSVPSRSRKYEAESQENTNMDSMPSVSPKIEAKSQENTNLDSLPSVSHKYKAYSQVNTNMDSVPSISHKYEADSQENTNLDSMPSVSYRNEESQGTCTSNGRKLESNSKSNEDYSPRSARGLGTAGNEVVNHIPMQVLSQPAVNSYGDRRQNNRRDWRQNNHSGKVRRDTDFGFQGRLQRKSYHQQQPVSPKQYPQAETGRPMPGSLDHPSQFVSSQIPQIEQGSQVHNPYQEAAATPANTMAPNAWPVQNVQQPNYISTSQPQLPVQSAPPQMSQSSILGQYGIQNSQAYNQMWQSYYYQQQLALQQLLHQAQQQPNPQQQQVLLQQYQQLHHQLQQQYAAQMQLQQPYQQQQLQQVQSQHDLQQQQYNQHSQMQQQQLQQPPQPHQQQQPSQPHQQQQQPPQPHQQQQQPPQPHHQQHQQPPQPHH